MMIGEFDETMQLIKIIKPINNNNDMFSSHTYMEGNKMYVYFTNPKSKLHLIILTFS